MSGGVVGPDTKVLEAIQQSYTLNPEIPKPQTPKPQTLKPLNPKSPKNPKTPKP